MTVKIEKGDCVVKLAKMTAGGVDLVFVDPPFNIGYDYPDYDDRKTRTEYIDWCATWVAGCHRVLKETGSLWVAIGDECVSQLDSMIVDSFSFHKRSHVIWYVTFGVNCSNNFSRSHTHLLYYTKHRKRFTFNRDEQQLRVASARQLKYNDKRGNPDGKLPDNTWVLHPDAVADCFQGAWSLDTWLESRVCGTFKAREDRGSSGRRGVPQMPVAILERIVLACSHRGELVVDPMSGTGTTAEACIRHGRRFLGFEISDQCVRSARQRIVRSIAGINGGVC